VRSLISLLSAFALFSLAVPANAATSEDTSEVEDIVVEEQMEGDVESSDNETVETVEEETVSDVVYEDVSEDVYIGVPDDVYEGIPEDVYEGIPEDVYGGIPEDVYEDDIVDDVYGEYPDEDYEDIPSDVYGDPEDVIENVYRDKPSNLEELTNKNNEVILDYTNKKSDGIQLYFVNSILKSLEDSKGNVSIVVKTNQLEVNIPAFLLMFEENAEFIVKNKTYDGALSTVYDFTIKYGENGILGEFEETPITLKFTIDPSKVKDWDNIRVVYIDDEGKKKEFLKPKSFNKETGEVVAEVTHFSSYGVFEVSNSGQDDNQNEDGSKEENKDGTPASEDKNTAGNDNKNGTSNGSSSNVSDKGKTATEGKKLPNTATNHYNLLMYGLAFMVLSGVVLFLQKGRKIVQR